MKRILFNFAVGGSLLLCLAAVALWVRSYWICDYLTHSSRDGNGDQRAILRLEPWRGVLNVYSSRMTGVMPPASPRQPATTRRINPQRNATTLPTTRAATAPAVRPRPVYHLPGGWQYIPQPVTPNRFFGRPQWSYLGFKGIKGTTITRSRLGTRLTGSLYMTAVPFYWIAAVTAVPPLIWLVGAIHRRRPSLMGCCRNCGYNLAGNISGVCPECGTPIPGNSPNPRDQRVTTDAREIP